MTDREKLVDLLWQCVDLDTPFGEIADYLLSNGVRLESKQATSDENKRWIPVSERLPEKWREQDNEYFGDEIEFIVHINGAQCATFLCFDGEKFYDQTTGEIYSVTHWMPLPNPPEEERQ